MADRWILRAVTGCLVALLAFVVVISPLLVNRW